MVIFNLDTLLFGSGNALNRAKTLAGGLYVFLIVWYVLLVAINNLGREEFVLLESMDLWNIAFVVGAVLISAWLGYSNGGLAVAGAVGLAFPASFATLAVVLSILELNEPDAPLWFFVLLLSVVGLLVAAAGFVIGWGVQFAIES